MCVMYDCDSLVGFDKYARTYRLSKIIGCGHLDLCLHISIMAARFTYIYCAFCTEILIFACLCGYAY